MNTLLFFVLFQSWNTFAEDPAPSSSTAAYIAVGEAKTKRPYIKFDLQPASDPLAQTSLRDATDMVQTDLRFIDYFEFNLPEATTVPDYVVKYSGDRKEKLMEITVELRQKDEASPILKKVYSFTPGLLKNTAHKIADELVERITGLPGVFRTKIVAVCDKKSTKKELFVMDFDGSNARQVSHHRSVILTPAWNPTGDKLAYSVIAKNRKNIKNTNLYEYDLNTDKVKLLSNKLGINSGAHFHPDGNQIALTMSFLGNSEIFILNKTTKDVTRLTQSSGADVDPNFSPDGKMVSFVSDRAGSSMIYRMNADGSNVQRLTYAGKYNATPAWSPRNNKIAFASWIDGIFDIFLMNPDGTTLERLTKSQGNNEDPAFSPDGQWIVFSSNRAGQKNIYVMNLMGTSVKRLTYGLGDCTSPRWSAQ